MFEQCFADGAHIALTPPAWPWINHTRLRIGPLQNDAFSGD